MNATELAELLKQKLTPDELVAFSDFLESGDVDELWNEIDRLIVSEQMSRE